MAKNTDENVMAMVEDELQKSPGTTTEQLYEKAKGVSAGIGKLTLRQFNARYPLQVKRRAGRSRGKQGSRKAKAVSEPRRPRKTVSNDGNGRDAVRDAFLRFASDMAAAEQRADLVKVLASVDRYVDEVIKARG